MGSADTPRLAVGAWLTPVEIRASVACYHAEFGRSMSNGTSVITEIA